MEVSEDQKVSEGGGSVEVKQRSPETTQYFNEIVMNTEFSGSRKTAYTWKTDMKIYVDGEKQDYLMDELNKNPHCLDNFACETNGKSRKISKTCIDSIRRFLLHKPEANSGTSVEELGNVV